MNTERRPRCTVTELARVTDAGVDWLKKQTDAGLINCERGPGGRRLYDPIQGPAQVRAIIEGKR